MLTEVRLEYWTNATYPPGHKATSVAPNCNNNNNIADANMLDSSDEDEMSDEKYDLYYHDELIVNYHSYPTPQRVYNVDLAPITLLICNSIRDHWTSISDTTWSRRGFPFRFLSRMRMEVAVYQWNYIDGNTFYKSMCPCRSHMHPPLQHW